MSYPIYNGVRHAGPPALQWLGLAAALVALPIFVLAGWDLRGWAVGAGLFAANKGSAYLIDRLARGKGEVTAVGMTGTGFLSRAWITFGALFLIAQFWDRGVGVAAAASFLVYFTVDLLVRSVTYVAARGEKEHPTKPQEAA